VLLFSVFEDNTVGGVGIVSTAFYPISFIGDNQFINNRGSSLNVSISNALFICIIMCVFMLLYILV